MTIHPKILERADNILSKEEEEALKQIEEITNSTVLNAIYTQEVIGQKRQSIVDFLKSKLDISDDTNVTDKTTESLANQYLDNITESDEEVFVFQTSDLRDDKEEEEEVDSSPDSIELG
jgi:hypothetical protein